MAEEFARKITKSNNPLVYRQAQSSNFIQCLLVHQDRIKALTTTAKAHLKTLPVFKETKHGQHATTFCTKFNCQKLYKGGVGSVLDFTHPMWTMVEEHIGDIGGESRGEPEDVESSAQDVPIEESLPKEQQAPFVQMKLQSVELIPSDKVRDDTEESGEEFPPTGSHENPQDANEEIRMQSGVEHDDQGFEGWEEPNPLEEQDKAYVSLTEIRIEEHSPPVIVSSPIEEIKSPTFNIPMDEQEKEIIAGPTEPRDGAHEMDDYIPDFDGSSIANVLKDLITGSSIVNSETPIPSDSKSTIQPSSPGKGSPPKPKPASLRPVALAEPLRPNHPISLVPQIKSATLLPFSYTTLNANESPDAHGAHYGTDRIKSILNVKNIDINSLAKVTPQDILSWTFRHDMDQETIHLLPDNAFALFDKFEFSQLRHPESLEPRHWSKLGSEIPDVGDSPAAAITRETVKLMSPESIGALPSGFISKMNSLAIDAFSGDQMATIKSEQLASLTKIHIEGLSPFFFEMLTLDQFKCLGGGVPLTSPIHPKFGLNRKQYLALSISVKRECFKLYFGESKWDWAKQIYGLGILGLVIAPY